MFVACSGVFGVRSRQFGVFATVSGVSAVSGVSPVSPVSLSQNDTVTSLGKIKSALKPRLHPKIQSLIAKFERWMPAVDR
jgi:hypothetical protein